MNDGHILTEYDQISRARSSEYNLESLASRDRVKEITPYQDCRVVLDPSDDNPTGYINASHIKVYMKYHN